MGQEYSPYPLPQPDTMTAADAAPSGDAASAVGFSRGPTNESYRGDPFDVCAQCGFPLHVSETRWDRGFWVHPSCMDQRGYMELVQPPQFPHPLKAVPRRTLPYWLYEKMMR